MFSLLVRAGRLGAGALGETPFGRHKWKCALWIDQGRTGTVRGPHSQRTIARPSRFAGKNKLFAFFWSGPKLTDFGASLPVSVCDSSAGKWRRIVARWTRVWGCGTGKVSGFQLDSVARFVKRWLALYDSNKPFTCCAGHWNVGRTFWNGGRCFFYHHHHNYKWEK